MLDAAEARHGPWHRAVIDCATVLAAVANYDYAAARKPCKAIRDEITGKRSLVPLIRALNGDIDLAD